MRITVGISWAIVLGWMLFIFLLSAQPAEQSGQLSKSVAGLIAGKSVDDKGLIGLNHTLRKNAHFFNYMILGIVVMNAFMRSHVSRRNAVLWSLALGLCVLFACSDEYHQLFVAGRGAQLKDVLIDSAGALTGIGLYRLGVRVIVR